MKFTIITPSYNQCAFLKRCVASIADQVDDGVKYEDLGVEQKGDLKLKTANLKHRPTGSISVHHQVQDGGSSDGTSAFLKEFVAQQPSTSTYQFTFASEPDAGMYDAINRGIEPTIEGSGYKVFGNGGNTLNPSLPAANCDDSIVAWLNCDEQYLPGTLGFVGEYFQRHPEVDMLFGDYLVVDREGELLAFRKGYAPRLAYIQASHLYNLSCTMFFRMKVFEALGGFDTKYKAASDEDFVVRALKAGFKAKHVRRYFSTFVFTGDNLGGSRVAEEERKELKQGSSFPTKLFRVPINTVRWIEKFSSGAYFQRFPLEYSIHAGEEPVRKTFASHGAGWKWPARGQRTKDRTLKL